MYPFNHSSKTAYLNCQVLYFTIFPFFYRTFFGKNKASAIDFLATYHFDFNKAFYEGVLSLSRSQEEALLQKGEYDNYKSNLFDYNKHISPETSDFVNRNRKIVKKPIFLHKK